MENGCVIAVGNLLATGAECNYNTVLHRVAWGGHQATARLLLDRGAEIEAQDFGHQTPLRRAALRGHEATVGLLLNCGADIEAKGLVSKTPLHLAAFGG